MQFHNHSHSHNIKIKEVERCVNYQEISPYENYYKEDEDILNKEIKLRSDIDDEDVLNKEIKLRKDEEDISLSDMM